MVALSGSGGGAQKTPLGSNEPVALETGKFLTWSRAGMMWDGKYFSFRDIFGGFSPQIFFFVCSHILHNCKRSYR